MTSGNRTLPCLRKSWVALLGCCCLSVFAGADLDGDRLKDKFEQELLERFRPVFLIASGDCDGLPSEFQPGSKTPIPIAANGTIYGQVFPVSGLAAPGAYLEIHYYHLWARDCGVLSHALDAERVSVLVRAKKINEKPKHWTAVFWQASAHEDTLCDQGHAASAAGIAAVESGARVWISRGKHASFLSPDRCGLGCGADVCDSPRLLPRGKLVNLGEANQPLNGAVWVQSKRWRLAGKMESDFTPAVVAELSRRAGTRIVTLPRGRGFLGQAQRLLTVRSSR